MKKEQYPLSDSRGFSLAELAVVVLIVAVISAFFLWRFVALDKGAGTRVPLTIITAEGVGWKPPNPAGTYALIAILVGDPAVPGSPYVIRARAVRNCEFASHGNNTDERITVLKGEAAIGLEYPGKRSESSRLPAGSFCLIPKATRHLLEVEAESLLQIEGIGPAQYVCTEPHTPRSRETGSDR